MAWFLPLLAALGKGVAATAAAAGKGVMAAGKGAAAVGGKGVAGAGKALSGGGRALNRIPVAGQASAPISSALTGVGDMAQRGGGVLKGITRDVRAAVPKTGGGALAGVGKDVPGVDLPIGKTAGSYPSKQSIDSQSTGGWTPNSPRKNPVGGALNAIGSGVSGLGKGMDAIMKWYRDNPTPLEFLPPMAKLKESLQGTQQAGLARDMTGLKELQPGSVPWFNHLKNVADRYGWKAISEYGRQAPPQREQAYFGPVGPEDQARINYYNRGNRRESEQDIYDAYERGEIDQAEAERRLGIGATGAPGDNTRPQAQPTIPAGLGESVQRPIPPAGKAVNPALGAGFGSGPGIAARIMGGQRPGSALSAIPGPQQTSPQIPPEIAAKIQKALDAGLTMQEIMQADDIKPYFMGR